MVFRREHEGGGVEESDLEKPASSPWRPHGKGPVNDPIAYTVAALALLVAMHAGVLLMRNAPVDNALFYTVAAFELVLVGLLVGGCIALARTDEAVDGVLFVSYLLTLVVIPPAAVLWGIAEKSRWGTGVVVVAMLTVAVLTIRLLGIWQGSYA